MSEPVRRWSDGEVAATPSEERAAQLVRSVAGIAPRPVDLSGWDGVIEKVARPKSALLPVWFVAAALAASLMVFTVARLFGNPPSRPIVAALPPSPEPRPLKAEPVERTAEVAVQVPSPSPAPLKEKAPVRDETLAAASGAKWSRSAEGTVQLDQGRLELKASVAEPSKVKTREVSVATTDARYAMEATQAGTSVWVFQGSVEVSTRGGVVVVRAGENKQFSTAQVPSALEPMPLDQASPSCARLSLEGRLSCLDHEAAGEGMRAQAALYEKAYLQANAGRTAAAEETLKGSLQRFPRGVLHPEVRIALMWVLVAQRRYEDAEAVAGGFLSACADDPRYADVQSFLKTLDWLRQRD
jgi:hypothetical protein